MYIMHYTKTRCVSFLIEWEEYKGTALHIIKFSAKREFPNYTKSKFYLNNDIVKLCT